MDALYVKKNQSALCAALCRYYEQTGLRLTEDVQEGEGVLWFADPEQGLTEAIVALLQARKEGAVLVMLPYFLWEGDPHRAAETEWAGGVCAAVRALALRFAPKLRINCLRYGVTEAEEHHRHRLDCVALGRAATVEELARAALFFVGEGSSYMTGQSIDVNGGRVY